MKILILLALFLGTLLSGSELENISLQLKWKYQFQFAGFIAAKEKGFYKEVGLDVDLLEYDDSIDTLERIEKGEVEFAVTDSSLILEAVKGTPVVAIMAIYQESPYVVMTLKSSGISRLEDLQDKKFAIYDDVNGMIIKSMLDAHKIDFIPEPVEEGLTRLQNKEVDAVLAYLPNEPYVAKERGMNVTILNPSNCGFSSYGDILFTSKELLAKRPELVAKMYEVSIRGFEYAFANIDEIVELIYRKYNTQNKSKKALRHEAELLKKMSGVDKDFGKLCKIKVGNIARIYDFMKFGNYNYDNLDHFIYQGNKQESELTPSKSKKPLFTQEELEYIKTKKSVKVCTFPTQFPFVILDEEGNEGISVEFLNLISQKTGLDFDFVVTESPKDHLQKIEDGVCDVAPMIATKPNVCNFIIPSSVLGSDTVVLATKIDAPYVSDLHELTNQKIGIERGTGNLKKYVKTLYPNMNLVDIENLNFDKVANGDLYGVVGASYEVAPLIAMDYSGELKIMSKVGDKKIDGSFGITTREPMLLDIINKSIDSIYPLERQKILNSWLSVEVKKQFDYTLFWKVMSLMFIVFVIVMIVHIRQRKLHQTIQALNETLEKRVKYEVEKNKQQQLVMLQQSRLAQMGEMISMIAHQWRQPLNNLSMINQSISLKYQIGKMDSELMKKLTHDGRQQIEQMSQTINDFRNFFKPDKEAESFALHRPIQQAVGLLNPILTQRGITIKLDIGENIIIKGFPNELGQVFINIINNAKDALVDKSNKEEKLIELSLKIDNSDIIISVRDNGGGIPPEIIDTIFDPYFTTKQEKNGTGLGLYMSKVIIEDHCGGELSVQNSSDGAVFKIVLKGKL